MKTITKKLIAGSVILMLTTIFYGCKKENAYLEQPITDSFSDDEATVLIERTDAVTTLVLRPGKNDGQDAFVQQSDAIPGWADLNYNSYDDLGIWKWTYNGSPITARTFIRFDSLVLVPSTAHVVLATLHLYGVNSSVTAPQGNSYYPGSPYNVYGDNRCLIHRVVGSNWKEKTITWNNQPSVDTTVSDTIPASNSQWNYDAEVDVTNLVKKIVAHPNKNFGFRISLVEEVAYRDILFSPSESEKSRRPKLVVKYQ